MPTRHCIKYESEENAKSIGTKRRRIKRESEEYSSSDLDGSPPIKLDDDLFDSGKHKSAAVVAVLIDPVLESDDDRSPEQPPRDVIPSADPVDASKSPSHKKSKGSKYNGARKTYQEDLKQLGRLVRKRHIAKAEEAMAKFKRARVEKKVLADSISQMCEQIKTIKDENKDLKLKAEDLEVRELELERLRRTLREIRTKESAHSIILKRTKTKLMEATQNLTAYHAMKEELQKIRKANENMRAENERLEAQVQERNARIKKQQQMFMAAAMEVCKDGMKSEPDAM